MWLSSGGEKDAIVVPQSARKESQRAKAGNENDELDDDDDNEALVTGLPDEEARRHMTPLPTVTGEPGEHIKRAHKKPSPRPQRHGALWFRGVVADAMDDAFESENLSYALKLVVAVILVSFPALVPSWNSWYAAARGVWAPLQLILVFEVAIGTSLFAFTIRAAGVIFGCLFGYLAFVVGRGNLVVLVVWLVMGIIPSAYVQLGTRYVKAGIISTVSMTVVALGKNGWATTSVSSVLKTNTLQPR